MGLSFLPINLKSQITEPLKFNHHQLNLPQYTALFFNQKHNKALKSLAVRQALAHAIDKQNLIQTVFQGEARVIDTPIINFDIATTSELTTYDYDPSASQKLLTDAKWKLTTDENGNNHWQKDDNTLSLTITTVNNPENTKVAEELKSYFSAIGIDTNLQIVDAVDIQSEIIKDRNFDILLYGEIIGADPDPFPFWHSSQSSYPGLNLSQFKEARTDTLLEQARQTNDKKIRQANYNSFQKIISETVPAIFLYSPSYTYVQDKRLKNFATTDLITPADRFNNLAKWYTKTKQIIK